MHPGRADVIGAGALIWSRVLGAPAVEDYRVSEADILYGIAWSLVDDAMTLLPHPVTGRPFASPVPPGTGWPDDPATPSTPVARTPAAVRRLAATDDLARARGADQCVRGLPTAGPLARGRGPRQARVVRGAALLGPPDRGLGRPDHRGRRRRGS